MESRELMAIDCILKKNSTPPKATHLFHIGLTELCCTDDWTELNVLALRIMGKAFKIPNSHITCV